MYRKETYKGTYNQSTLIGGLKEVPQIRKTEEGIDVVTIDLATKYPSKNLKTGKFEDKTEWHMVVLFDDLARKLLKIGRSGMRLMISGPKQAEIYESHDRIIKETKIVANVLEPMDPVIVSENKKRSSSK